MVAIPVMRFASSRALSTQPDQTNRRLRALRRWMPGLLASIALASCEHHDLAKGPSPTFKLEQTHSKKPVIVVIIDQLSSWEFVERAPLLSAESLLPEPHGGLALLQKRGFTFERMLYPHAISDTAPGHAMLFTGKPASVSGIVNNEALRNGRIEGVYLDPASTLLLPPVRFGDSSSRRVACPKGTPPSACVDRAAAQGTSKRSSSSLAALQVETVADAFRREHPNAKIFAFSLKDRAALPAGGRSPTLAMWLDGKSRKLVTSSSLGLREFPETYVHQADIEPWLRRAPGRSEWQVSKSTIALGKTSPEAAFALAHDNASGEGEVSGFGTTFPHRIVEDKWTETFRAMPIADELLVEAGLSALDQSAFAGNSEAPNKTALRAPAFPPALLVLSLSAHDYIGHYFGPDSLEAWDEFVRLDALVLKLMKELDQRFGEDGYTLMLTSDHGIGANAEYPGSAGKGAAPCDALGTRRCGPGKRLDPDQEEQALVKVLQHLSGLEKPLLGFPFPYVVFTDALRTRFDSLEPMTRSYWLRLLEGALSHATVTDVKAQTQACDSERKSGQPHEKMDILCQTVSTLGGDLFIEYPPAIYMDTQYAKNGGANHGSRYLYDREVPLVVVAPGRARSGSRWQRRIDARSFAATLADALDLKTFPTNGTLLAPPRASRDE
jgi:arylsulfatase A-like enzyme